jgi:phosphoadenosine phosphosulfate reductase
VKEKVKRATQLITDALGKYNRVAIASSFGKDSMVVLHIATGIKPDIPVFSVMTIYKPFETYFYLVRMAEKMKLNLKIYMVAAKVPAILNGQNVVLLPIDNFLEVPRTMSPIYKPLYETNPDKCCDLLKVAPTREAVKNLDAWITGLRNTEGRTRVDYQEVEEKGGLAKINPILNFTEKDVWSYIKEHDIEPHPWYSEGYRSIGCSPCSNPGGKLERDGRWQGTSKCGGECGIHTQNLK